MLNPPRGIGTSCTLPGMSTGVVASIRSTLTIPSAGRLTANSGERAPNELLSAVPRLSMGHSDATVRITPWMALCPSVEALNPVGR